MSIRAMNRGPGTGDGRLPAMPVRRKPQKRGKMGEEIRQSGDLRHRPHWHL